MKPRKICVLYGGFIAVPSSDVDTERGFFLRPRPLTSPPRERETMELDFSVPPRSFDCWIKDADFGGDIMRSVERVGMHFWSG